jgi:acetyl-CoA C-acetyltransferase
VPSPLRPPDSGQPVLVGLGAVSDGANAVELMTRAVRAAADDAGAPALLASLDRVVVLQGSWSLTNPARTVARRVGSPEARTVLCQIGVSQQEAINAALGSVARGACDAVVVVGGEAQAWARSGGAEPDEEHAPPDEVATRPPDFVAPIEAAAGMVLPPVLQYALIENALAAAEGLTAEAQRDEIAALWARCNEVARSNPAAAFPAPLTAADIATPGPSNRPLAFPYNRWHASQWTVDQATALLVCSAARAADAGVPADRWLFPRVALHSSQAVTLTARRRLHAWPGMGVLGRAAEAHLGRRMRDLPLAEVYSCFPAAVRVQQRELGLDPSGTPTLTGGMAFAGGPFNHFVLQSMVTLAGRLRADPSALGLVTTVSGMLSKPGLAVWSASPAETDRPSLVADLGAETVAGTEVVSVVPEPPGDARATVVSFTVTYGGPDRADPERTAVVADLADGVRTAATCEDAATARLALREGLVGRDVRVKDTTFTL